MGPRFRTEKPDWPNVFYWALFAIVFVIGAGLFGIRLGATDLMGDEYHAMFLVKHSLLTYISSFQYGLLIKVQFWICNRLFGDSLVGYRLPALAAGLATLFLLMWLARRFWPGRKYLPFVAGFFLALNAQCWYFFRWGMANYGEYILTGTILLYLFLYLVEKPLGQRGIALLVVLILVSPFIYFTLLIAYFAGAAALVLVRRRENDPDGFIRRIGSAIWEFKYFLVAPVVFLYVRWMDPNWDFYANRDGLHSGFVAVGYEHTLVGLWTYVAEKTTILLAETIQFAYSPFPVNGIWYKAVLFLSETWWWALPIGLLLPFEGGRLSRRRLFLSIYFVICLACVAVLGTMGLYPFGQPRYAMYMLPAMLILIGLGLGDVVLYLIIVPVRRLAGPQRLGAALGSVPARVIGLILMGVFVVAAAAGMADLLFSVRDARAAARSEYNRLLATIRADRSDVVLMDYIACCPWMPKHFPNVWQKTERMKRGAVAPSASFVARMLDEKRPVSNVLIVSWDIKPWADLTTAESGDYKKYFAPGAFKPVQQIQIDQFYLLQLTRVRPNRPDLRASTSTLVVKSWGPRTVTSSAPRDIWIKAGGLNKQTLVMCGNTPLPTVAQPKSDVVTATIAPACIPRAGDYELYLLDTQTKARSESVWIHVVDQ